MSVDELLSTDIYTFMKFRDWLLNEHFGDGGSSWDLLYPTTGGDYADVNNNPLSHFWLQWKWDRGTDPDIGRTLHNIDNDDFQKRGYASVSSNSMPDVGDGFWEHKPDDGTQSSIKPYRLPELKWVVMGKTSKETKFLPRDRAGKVKIWAGHDGATSVCDDTNLDDIFHDEDRQTHCWPSVDEKYMDSDWALPRHRAKSFKEDTLNEGDFLGSGFHVYPTIAPDWLEALDSTKKIKLVKDRWEEEEGRLKFINIDLESLKKIPFKSLNSRNMPDVGSEFWTHKEDDGSESFLKVEESPDLPSYGIADKSDKELNVDNGPKTTHPFGFQSVAQPNHRLNSLFNDRPSGKFPEVDEKYADEDWTLAQHRPELMKEHMSFKQWMEYGLGSGTATSLPWAGHHSDGETNRTLPVRSKWVTKDGQNSGDESGDVKDPDLTFGYKRRPKSKKELKRRSRNIDNRSNRPKRVDVSDIIY